MFMHISFSFVYIFYLIFSFSVSILFKDFSMLLCLSKFVLAWTFFFFLYVIFDTSSTRKRVFKFTCNFLRFISSSSFSSSSSLFESFYSSSSLSLSRYPSYPSHFPFSPCLLSSNFPLKCDKRMKCRRFAFYIRGNSLRTDTRRAIPWPVRVPTDIRRMLDVYYLTNRETTSRSRWSAGKTVGLLSFSFGISVESIVEK